MLDTTLRTVLLLLALAVPAAAQPAPVAGVYALPEGRAKVSASLVMSPAAKTAVPGRGVLDVAMTKLGGSQPITRYDVELGKRLHLIAVSDDGRFFVHEHGEAPGAGGHFRVPMTFPRLGRWHIFADAVPLGLGQQVMRFDVDLGGVPDRAAVEPAGLQPTGLEGRDGAYGVRFDALDLRAGAEAMPTLQLLRDGKPAGDVTPYLGVAAHAVFVLISDWTYVHAHAACHSGAWDAGGCTGWRREGRRRPS